MKFLLVLPLVLAVLSMQISEGYGFAEKNLAQGYASMGNIHVTNVKYHEGKYDLVTEGAHHVGYEASAGLPVVITFPEGIKTLQDLGNGVALLYLNDGSVILIQKLVGGHTLLAQVTPTTKPY